MRVHRRIAASPRSEPKQVDTRIVDTRVDAAWSNLAQALDAVRTLPRSNRAAPAAEVYDKLFAEGLTFLQLEHPAQWAQCRMRLEIIDEQGLEPKIEAVLGGPEYLIEIRAAQAEFGAALGIDQPKPAPTNVNLADAISELRSAIETYVSEVIAWSRRSPDASEDARTALRPIDERREAAARAMSRRGTQAANTPTGEEPPPDVSPETPVP